MTGSFPGSAGHLRIALVAPFGLLPKGTTRWRVLPLARALARSGHAVRVVVPPYDWPAHAGRRWLDQGVEVRCVQVSSRTRVLGQVSMARRLVQAALDWQPDIVHCFKPKGPSGMAAWTISHVAPQVPLVVDTDDWERGWNALAGYSLPAAWFFARQERLGLKCAQAVTAASQWLVDLATAYRQQAVGVFYVPNGLEPWPGLRTTQRSGPGRTVLLVTRFVEHSPGQVWRIWRRIEQRMGEQPIGTQKEPEVTLLVAGRGVRAEENRLRALVDSSGGRSNVRVLGWVPSCVLPALFAAADVAMLPVLDTPLNRAKSPMRLVHLLAFGVPTATQAVGEYGTYVRHEETGLLAEAGDEAGLAHAVLRLLREETLRQQLGQAAAQHLRTTYAWDRLVGTVLEAYEYALGAPRRRV